jgi:hypothetical protein
MVPVLFLRRLGVVGVVEPFEHRVELGVSRAATGGTHQPDPVLDEAFPPSGGQPGPEGLGRGVRGAIRTAVSIAKPQDARRTSPSDGASAASAAYRTQDRGTGLASCMTMNRRCQPKGIQMSARILGYGAAGKRPATARAASVLPRGMMSRATPSRRGRPSGSAACLFRVPGDEVPSKRRSSAAARPVLRN